MSATASSVAATTARRGTARRFAAVLVLLGGAVAASCLGRATPTETFYPDRYDRVYELCLGVVHDLGGEVITESRFTRVITARFPEEVFGYGVYLDISVERREDESWVRAETRPESAKVPEEDLESLRARFYDALAAACDAAGVGQEGLRRGAPGSPPDTVPGTPPRGR